MTKLLVTGGLVAVEDGAKHDPADQYSLSRKVRVEIKFDVSEDQEPDDVLALAGDMASDRVNQLLGRTAASTARRVETETTAEPARRTRRTKEQIAADKAAEAGGPQPPASSEPPTTGDAGGDQTSGEVDEWELPGEPNAEPVSDAELNAAVQKRNVAPDDAPKIRKLIGSYNPDPTMPFQLRQIPAEKRQDFLAKLAGPLA